MIGCEGDILLEILICVENAFQNHYGFVALGNFYQHLIKPLKIFTFLDLKNCQAHTVLVARLIKMMKKWIGNFLWILNLIHSFWCRVEIFHKLYILLEVYSWILSVFWDQRDAARIRNSQTNWRNWKNLRPNLRVIQWF